MENKIDERIYRFWWLHDAAWYQNVAKRFGFEAANELNKESLRYMALRTMQAHVRENRIDTAFANIEDMVKHLMEGTLLMWPATWLQTDVHILSPDTFDVVITKNFAIEMLRRARTLEHYACPCLAAREGWFAAIGVKYYDQELKCMVLGDDVCHFRTRVEVEWAHAK
jgi:hypothetical protein